jgi:hypothetical protein
MTRITVERLPPERDAAGAAAAAAGGCCCCCCCCLHSVGSLIGAASAKASRTIEATDPPSAVIGASTAEPTYSIARHYWMAVLVLSVLAVGGLATVFSENERMLGIAILMAILMPGVQLLASLAALVMSVISKRPGHQERLSHLGRITVRSVFGTLIGLAVMFAMYQILRV